MRKYDQYRFWHCKAEEEFTEAVECEEAGMPMAAGEHYLWHWHYLFRAAEANWFAAQASTEKQKEQQRLWVQRGLYERTKANLKAVIAETKSLEVGYAVALCDRYIEKNKKAFQELKERI